ncbi:MAG: hypothetical protein J0L88_02315 [Xanthomonadales bacterium]|nr:hypothetical protein [Xanthomonadales bacterium]
MAHRSASGRHQTAAARCLCPNPQIRLAKLLARRRQLTDQGIVIFGALSELIENIAVGAYQEVQSRSWAFGSARRCSA